MTKRTIVIRRGDSCRWQPKFTRGSFCSARIIVERKNISVKEFAGFIHLKSLVFLFFALALFFYLHSINSQAAKGYQIRQIEQKISELKKEKEKLIIKEAELKSLYHIEEESKNLNMENLKNVSFIEETSPIAMQ